MADPLPLNVSPLIKAARWTLLISGMVYGFSRYNILMSRERKRLAELERTRPEREAREAEEKKRRDMAEIEELEKLSRGSN